MQPDFSHAENGQDVFGIVQSMSHTYDLCHLIEMLGRLQFF